MRSGSTMDTPRSSSGRRCRDSSSRACTRSNAPSDPEVKVESYHRNGFVLTVDAPRAGLVYASESYFIGWSARINGVPTTIMPANYAFRAVDVPAGRSRIEFSYWPPGLTAGLSVSVISAVLLGLYVVQFDRWRKWMSITQPA